jgi:murein DD-endopeptidase MepM/ murein hydrolase activator NlpD
LEKSPLSPLVVEKRTSCKRDSFLRSFRRHLCAVLSFAALFVLFSAGIAYFLRRQTKQGIRAYSSALTPIASTAPRIPEFKEIVGTFEKKQTIAYALATQGLSGSLINQIIDCARPLHNLGKIRAGQSYWLSLARDGSFRNFRYPVDDERYLTVYHDEKQDRLVSVMKNFPYETRVEPVSAVIEGSLFSTILEIGERDQLALSLADIFGSDIDFYTDIQRGDSFKVLIEKKYLNGQFVKYGAILAAGFRNKQKLLTGYRFQDENGIPAYFGPDGKSLKRSFLKSPLKFARITSKFSLARWHPILKVLRPHLGVDYAAQVGTPVQAVGAGIVTACGYSGGNGNMVRIRHAGRYESMYLHLSRMAVKPGAHVSQGQVIGYVGSTGLSTGPHLDFRVLQNGKPVNPLKVISPPGAPVSPNLIDRFAALRDKLNDQLNMPNDKLSRMP